MYYKLKKKLFYKVILDNLTNTLVKLLEIKCNFKGKTLGSLNLLNCIKFIIINIKGN